MQGIGQAEQPECAVTLAVGVVGMGQGGRGRRGAAVRTQMHSGVRAQRAAHETGCAAALAVGMARGEPPLVAGAAGEGGRREGGLVSSNAGG